MQRCSDASGAPGCLASLAPHNPVLLMLPQELSGHTVKKDKTKNYDVLLGSDEARTCQTAITVGFDS